MFFTQEDYKKIYDYISRNSVKDTEFCTVTPPLEGNEYITLVQDGCNRKMMLKPFVQELLKLGIPDFFNITEDSCESYISLNQAIKLIPFKSRKVGQVITFVDETGEWKIYQFTGLNVNQWNTIPLWEDLMVKFQKIQIKDSEDIVLKDDDTLLFANKIYNPEDYSGLGRVYLRKNIVDVEDPSTGEVINANLLTQSMLAKENTIYILQYDYNLNNQTITIPEGCILDMRGGSVINGTINCVDTIIISTDDSKLDVTLTGTYRFDSEKLVTSNTEDINISQSVNGKSHTISAMLADRDTTNGMGYVILRKNMVNGVNVLTQEMINQANTIYEIRYDFDLNGQEVTIPEGCTLDFQGGSLSNGTLDFNYCIIQSELKQIFYNVIPVKVCKFCYFDWFYYETNPEKSLQSLLNLIQCREQYDYDNHTIKFSSKKYTLSSSITAYSFVTLLGDKTTSLRINNGDGIIFNRKTSYAYFNVLNMTIHTTNSYAINFSNGDDEELRAITISRCIFKNLNLYTGSSTCVYSGNNKGSGGDSAMAFQLLFYNIRCASTEYYFDGLKGTNNIFQRINEWDIHSPAAKCKAWFHNTTGTFRDINGTFNYVNHFILFSNENYTYNSDEATIYLENVNIEEYQNVSIYNNIDSVKLNLMFINVSMSHWVNVVKHPYIKSNGGFISITGYPKYRGIDTSNRWIYFATTIQNDFETIKLLGIPNLSILKSESDESSAYEMHIIDEGINRSELIYNTSTFFYYSRKKSTDYIDILKNNFVQRERVLLSNNSIFNNQTLGYSGNLNVTIESEKLVEIWGWNIKKSEGSTFSILNNGNFTVKIINSTNKDNYQFITNTGKDLYLTKGNFVVGVFINSKFFITYCSYEINNKGTTEQRPILQSTDEGFEYYDSTLKKKILWNGSEWTNLDGTPLI